MLLNRMLDDGLNLLPYIPDDRFVAWEPLHPGMNVIGLFDAEDMTRVVGGIENDEDMCDFCRFTGNWFCYVMKDLKSGCPMAFCVIEVEEQGRSVQFHGGRVPDYRNTLLVYRGTAIMLKTLLDLNYEVGTTSEYARSERFLYGLGFVKWKVENGLNYMRLTRESYEKSPVLRRMACSDAMR